MNSLVPVFDRMTLIGHLTGSRRPQKSAPSTFHPSQSSFLLQWKPGIAVRKGVEASVFDYTLIKDHAPCLVLTNGPEYLGGGIPVDERGIWHCNGPPFFLEVRHLSLDSAFQTLLYQLKATQCINLSLIRQYKGKDSMVSTRMMIVHNNNSYTCQECHVFSMESSSLYGLLVPELPNCGNGLDTQHNQPHDL